jgi:hypothetical protein
VLDEPVPPPLPISPPPLPPLSEPLPPPLPLPLPEAPPALPVAARVEPPVEPEGLALAALVEQPRFADLKLVEGVPTRLSDEALYLETAGARKAKIDYAKVDAIAVAAVEGIGSKPVLLLDLLLNWNDCSEGPLRAVRLRSDTFDARTLARHATRPSDTLREFAALLRERCAAAPLPDAEAVAGRPFAVYESLASYEREVLQVDR